MMRSSTNMWLCVFHPKNSRPSLTKEEAVIWYVDCSHEYKINQGVMVGGIQPSVEDILWWRTTSGGRQPSVEDNLWWKTTFGGRWPSVEDDFWWKMTSSGRHPSVLNDLWFKTTFGGRQPVVENNLCWIFACCLLCFPAFFLSNCQAQSSPS